MSIPDNYSQWEFHEAEHERWLKSRPVCDHCGDPIQKHHLYRINDSAICPDCMELYFREEIDE